MSLIAKKLTTAKHVFQDQGVGGLLTTLKERSVSLWRGDDVNWKDNSWNRCVGKLIELQGNVVKIDGCKFSVDSPAIPTHLKSCFSSKRYEAPEREALKKFLDPKLPVVEFGGCIGVVSCLTNKKLQAPEKHVVVEANPDMIPLLEKNRDRNRCHFTVLHRAIAYGSNEITFYRNDVFLSSNVRNAWGESPDRAVRVLTISLRNILDELGFGRCTLICDIEGAEFDLVQHEADVLRQSVVSLMIEVHDWIDAELAQSMFSKLQEISFNPVYKKGGTYIFQNSVLNQA